jgi:hypothetical protein
MAALVAACGPAAAASAPAASRTTPTTLGIGPAPKVPSPLSVAAFVAAPCTSISLSIPLGSMLVDAPVFADDVHGTPLAGSGGKGCEWRSVAHKTDLTVTWQTGYPDGLNHVYARWSTFAVWSPTQIADYPAVFASQKDNWNHGTGDMYVAFSDQVYCQIHFSAPGIAPPSGELQEAGYAMLATIKAG